MRLSRLLSAGAPRLARALLRLAEGAPDQVVHAAHQELADMVATYRETATLALHRLQRRGLVTLGRRSVRLLDPPRLRQEAAA